jgi:hypothetical protein
MVELSPYCVRCNPFDHGHYRHLFHETNEHDDWLTRARAEEQEG